MKRRHFLYTLAGALAAASVSARAQGRRAPRILLRSSWQTHNIGDVAHTPGMLALLEKYIPEAQVRVLPTDIGGCEEMLRRRFPKVEFLEPIDPTDGPALDAAFEGCDLFIHGSGALLIAKRELTRWRKTGKPYGVYGISLKGPQEPNAMDLLNGAAFAYFRDSVSLEHAKSIGVQAAVMGFAPDAAFATDLRDDAAAAAFLKTNGLEEGKFLCCIPKYHTTPRWIVQPEKYSFDKGANAYLEKWKERDHAPLREAILRVVTETDLKVLICPEDLSHMALGKEVLYDKLPPRERERVVWRETFWPLDEAVSVYVRSAGMFSNDMHSPIMCIGNGIPAIVCRWKEQTSKGIMWRDIGLGDWLFDLDNPADPPRVAPAVVEMAKNPEAARAKAAKARAFVNECQRETMGVVKATLPAG